MKLKILTMAYTRPDIIYQSLESLYASGIPLGFEHYVLDQHYPMPMLTDEQAWLKLYCKQRGIKIIDAGKNLGYHEGINWAVEQMDLEDGDIVLNYDPDAKIERGWIGAILEVFKADPTLAVVGFNNEVIDRELRERGYFDEKTAGHTLRFMHRPVVMSIIAWQAGFIRKVGGLKENTLHYGGVEAVMFPILCAHNRRWAVLLDHWENTSLWGEADPEYLDWKRRHGQEHSFTGSFDEYLKQIGVIK